MQLHLFSMVKKAIFPMRPMAIELPLGTQQSEFKNSNRPARNLLKIFLDVEQKSTPRCVRLLDVTRVIVPICKANFSVTSAIILINDSPRWNTLRCEWGSSFTNRPVLMAS